MHHTPPASKVRTVTGHQPEGIRLTQWTGTSILVSWSTGSELPCS